MTDIGFWRLSEHLSVVDAALLIIEVDPSEIRDNVLTYSEENRPNGFTSVFESLKSAIQNGSLQATIRRDTDYEHGAFFTECDVTEFISIDQKRNTVIVKESPNWRETTIPVDILKAWLNSREFNSGFFFQQNDEPKPSYLDPNTPCYSLKLHAAILAWEAVSTCPNYSKNKKTPKQNIIHWLKENAKKLGLTNENGGLKITPIENEIALVSNWQHGGVKELP
ncbi:hypothetical protein JYU12_02345 [bacterium AH-315-K03]|nr:hypothetical protein [bacterium AH-315-K03]